MKKNKIYLISLTTIFLIIISCNSKKEIVDRCAQFKNGNFIFHFHSPKGDIDFSIQRKDSIQTETDKKTGNNSKLLIKWTDDCAYNATLIESSYHFSDTIQKMRKAIPLETEIISWSNDYYVFRSFRGNSYIMTDTMWVEK